MLQFKTLSGAVLMSLASLALAQSGHEARADRELAVDGTSAVTIPSGAADVAGAQGRAFKEPGLTREEVMAEFVRTRNSGERERLIAEQGGHN